MEEYITIKEACLLTGKSDKTIRNNFTSKKEEINKLTSKKVVIKKGRNYGILKSYLLDFYQIKTGNVTSKSGNETGKVTSKKPSKTGKKDKFTSKYIAHLESQIETKDNQINELVRQNDQWQRMVVQLQQTNAKLLLEEKETSKPKKRWWRRNN